MLRNAILCAVLLIAAHHTSMADMPQTISYQGSLRYTDGTIVPDGDYDATFRLYDAESEGDSLWGESNTLDVERGMFNVILGKIRPLDRPFDETYWLEVEIDGQAITERMELTASPYAFHAAVADAFADGDSPPDGDWTIVGNDMYSGVPGNVGIGTTNPSHRLEIIDDAEMLGLVSESATSGLSIKAYRESPYTHAFIRFRAARGTKSSPAALQCDDQIARLISSGHDGSGFDDTAEICARVDGDPSEDGMSARIEFLTKENEASPLETRMTIKGNGRVGIGMLDPAFALDVADTVNMTCFRMPTAASSGYVLTSDASGVGTWAAAGGLPAGASGQTLRHDGATWLSNSLLFNDGTNIGVGTTTPGAKLDVDGYARATRVQDRDNTSFYVDPADAETAARLKGSVKINPDGGDSAYVVIYGDQPGGHEIGGLVFCQKTTPWQSYQAAGVSAKHTGTLNMPKGVLLFRTNDGNFQSGYKERMRIMHDGKVGIGTDSPQAKLHIGGAPDVDGIMFPDGTLQTTAAGGGGGCWGLSGNSGTTPGTHFLGTTDNQALELKVNNSRVMRMEPGTNPNIIVGGASNWITAGVEGATISGGAGNRVTDRRGVVGGGTDNQAGDGDADYETAMDATVSGGDGNTASGTFSAIVGGWRNTASGSGAAIGGGYDNIASGYQSCIPGGERNAARGDKSLAAGMEARANHDGAVVITAAWDATYDSTSSGGTNHMILRADGGLYVTNAGGVAPYDVSKLINTVTGAHLSTGGQWVDSSDRNLKENFTSIDRAELLERIAALPITNWNYKVEDDDARHIGPVAQDFRAIFDLGYDDKTISPMDMAGISVAGVQGVYQLLREKDAQLIALKARIDRLEARLAASE